MRNLKKLLEKIYRKAALQLVKRGMEAPKPPSPAVSDEPVKDAEPGAS